MADVRHEPDVDAERRTFASILLKMRKHSFDDGFDAGVIYCAHLLEVAPDRIKEISLAAAQRLHVPIASAL